MKRKDFVLKELGESPFTEELNQIKNFIPEIWSEEMQKQALRSSAIMDFLYETVDRTWKERLLTIPFRPFRKTKKVLKKTLKFAEVSADTVHIGLLKKEIL